MYTIRFLQPGTNAAGAITSRHVTIDGDTDITDVADWLCRDSTATEYNDLLAELSERGLPDSGDYIAAVYKKIHSGRPPSKKQRVNLTLDTDLREWAECKGKKAGMSLSGYIETLIQNNKNQA